MTDSCIYCGHAVSKTLYPTSDLWERTYTLKKCEQCAAVFLSPRPDAAILAIAYDESYYGCSEKKFKGPVEKVLDFFRRQRARRISKLLPGNGAVLDIGCGNGNFLMSLLRHGSFSLYGSELPGKSAQRAAQHKEINLSTKPVTESDFAADSFDAITMFHVFEHLTEPVPVLQFIKRTLKSGGHLVVSFPNIDSWQSRFFKGKWLHLDPPRHLFFFGPDDFIAHMKKIGFELVSDSYFSMEQNPYGFIQSFLNLFLKKREVLFEHLKGNTGYTAAYSKASMLLQKMLFAFLFPFAIVGDAIAALFRKGATVEFTFRKLS